MRVNYNYTLTILAALIVLGSLWYSNQLVQRLAEKEERLVEFWAEVYKHIGNSANSPDGSMSQETSFLINHIIIQKPAIISAPAIVTDEKGVPIFNNLELDSSLTEEQQKKRVLSELERMKQNDFKPISIEYFPGHFHKVYYRETDELIQLRYFPYITLLVLGIFISIVFANFYVAQKSEQNKVWVGLAKETAHQLGTPISGLMAWVEVLRLKFENTEDIEIADELEKDIKHLEIITERFSKIGSDPDLKPVEIAPLLENAVQYVRSRAGRARKVSIEFKNELPDGFKAPIAPTLFAWVIENLVKNALDAMSNRTGYIHVTASSKNNELVIDVEDNGKGISRKNVNKIFNPGFTTKKRGWGLGLSLSKRIIQNYHRGRIFVKRTEIEKGTTFRITLSTKIPRQKPTNPSDERSE